MREPIAQQHSEGETVSGDDEGKSKKEKVKVRMKNEGRDKKANDPKEMKKKEQNIEEQDIMDQDRKGKYQREKGRNNTIVEGSETSGPASKQKRKNSDQEIKFVPGTFVAFK
jgi:hypothetical protein